MFFKTLTTTVMIIGLTGCVATLQVGVGIKSGNQQYRGNTHGGYQQQREDSKCRRQPDGRWVRRVQGRSEECPAPANQPSRRY